MYIVEIVLHKKKKAIDPREISQKIAKMNIESFLDSLRYSGQIVTWGDIVETEKYYKIWANIYKKDSLESICNNKHVDSQIKKLKKDNILSIEYTIIGKSVAGKNPCTCKEHHFFILYRNFLFIDSPIRCGTCFLPVPLYTIRQDKTKNFEFLDQWENSCRVFFDLFIDSGAYEQYAIHQLSDCDSELTEEGLFCCETLHDETKIKTYYCLDDCNNEERYSDFCPKCNERWRLEEKLHDTFQFKCDTCFLLATLFG